MNNSKTKSLAYAAILLALCIVSQFLKNLSVYITGPIINTCLILCVMTAGIGYALAISVITPVTSFVITGSPIMSAIPLIIPCVMVGNIILVLCVFFLHKCFGKKLGFPVSMLVGVVLKALFMGLVIALWVIPAFIPEKMAAKTSVFQTTFSVTQLITGLIGAVLAYIIFIPISKTIKNQ